MPQSEANAEMMVKEKSKSGKDILEKITNKVPLSEKDLEFAKGVGEGLVVESPALAAAMWKSGPQKNAKHEKSGINAARDVSFDARCVGWGNGRVCRGLDRGFGLKNM